ncbi:unnamed protein product, partial [Protopolystoma xenopodis]
QHKHQQQQQQQQLWAQIQAAFARPSDSPHQFCSQDQKYPRHQHNNDNNTINNNNNNNNNQQQQQQQAAKASIVEHVGDEALDRRRVRGLSARSDLSRAGKQTSYCGNRGRLLPSEELESEGPVAEGGEADLVDTANCCRVHESDGRRSHRASRVDLCRGPGLQSSRLATGSSPLHSNNLHRSPTCQHDSEFTVSMAPGSLWDSSRESQLMLAPPQPTDASDVYPAPILDGDDPNGTSNPDYAGMFSSHARLHTHLQRHRVPSQTSQLHAGQSDYPRHNQHQPQHQHQHQHQHQRQDQRKQQLYPDSQDEAPGSRGSGFLEAVQSDVCILRRHSDNPCGPLHFNSLRPICGHRDESLAPHIHYLHGEDKGQMRPISVLYQSQSSDGQQQPRPADFCRQYQQTISLEPSLRGRSASSHWPCRQPFGKAVLSPGNRELGCLVPAPSDAQSSRDRGGLGHVQPVEEVGNLRSATAHLPSRRGGQRRPDSASPLYPRAGAGSPGSPNSPTSARGPVSAEAGRRLRRHGSLYASRLGRDVWPEPRRSGPPTGGGDGQSASPPDSSRHGLVGPTQAAGPARSGQPPSHWLAQPGLTAWRYSHHLKPLDANWMMHRHSQSLEAVGAAGFSACAQAAPPSHAPQPAQPAPPMTSLAARVRVPFGRHSVEEEANALGSGASAVSWTECRQPRAGASLVLRRGGRPLESVEIGPESEQTSSQPASQSPASRRNSPSFLTKAWCANSGRLTNFSRLLTSASSLERGQPLLMEPDPPSLQAWPCPRPSRPAAMSTHQHHLQTRGHVARHQPLRPPSNRHFAHGVSPHRPAHLAAPSNLVLLGAPQPVRNTPAALLEPIQGLAFAASNRRAASFGPTGPLFPLGRSVPESPRCTDAASVVCPTPVQQSRKVHSFDFEQTTRGLPLGLARINNPRYSPASLTLNCSTSSPYGLYLSGGGSSCKASFDAGSAALPAAGVSEATQECGGEAIGVLGDVESPLIVCRFGGSCDSAVSSVAGLSDMMLLGNKNLIIPPDVILSPASRRVSAVGDDLDAPAVQADLVRGLSLRSLARQECIYDDDDLPPRRSAAAFDEETRSSPAPEDDDKQTVSLKQSDLGFEMLRHEAAATTAASAAGAGANDDGEDDDADDDDDDDEEEEEEEEDVPEAPVSSYYHRRIESRGNTGRYEAERLKVEGSAQQRGLSVTHACMSHTGFHETPGPTGLGDGEAGLRLETSETDESLLETHLLPGGLTCTDWRLVEEKGSPRDVAESVDVSAGRREPCQSVAGSSVSEARYRGNIRLAGASVEMTSSGLSGRRLPADASSGLPPRSPHQPWLGGVFNFSDESTSVAMAPDETLASRRWDRHIGGDDRVEMTTMTAEAANRPPAKQVKTSREARRGIFLVLQQRRNQRLPSHEDTSQDSLETLEPEASGGIVGMRLRRETVAATTTSQTTSSFDSATTTTGPDYNCPHQLNEVISSRGSTSRSRSSDEQISSPSLGATVPFVGLRVNEMHPIKRLSARQWRSHGCDSSVGVSSADRFDGSRPTVIISAEKRSDNNNSLLHRAHSKPISGAMDAMWRHGQKFRSMSQSRLEELEPGNIGPCLSADTTRPDAQQPQTLSAGHPVSTRPANPLGDRSSQLGSQAITAAKCLMKKTAAKILPTRESNQSGFAVTGPPNVWTFRAETNEAHDPVPPGGSGSFVTETLADLRPPVRPKGKKHKFKRDYSIDEYSNALFNAFLQNDPHLDKTVMQAETKRRLRSQRAQMASATLADKQSPHDSLEAGNTRISNNSADKGEAQSDSRKVEAEKRSFSLDPPLKEGLRAKIRLTKSGFDASPLPTRPRAPFRAASTRGLGPFLKRS